MVRNSKLPKSISILLSAITLAFLSACTQNKGPATVEITIPDFARASTKLFSQSVSAQSAGDGGGWGLADPAGIAELQCFGLFVGGPDSGLDAGKAFDINQSLLFSFGIVQGLVGPGGTLRLTVPSGPRRTLTLVGFGLANGATCESFTNQNHQLTSSRYSAPFILAQTTVDLSPGDSPPISLRATYTVGSSVKLGDVHFPNGRASGGGGSTIYLGSGLDGDITITNSPLTYLNLIQNQAMNRYLSTTAQVPSITRPAPIVSPNRYSLSLSGSVGSFTSMHFDVGDEVMLYISAARGTGCGGQLSPGFRIPGKVLSTPSGNSIDVNFADPRVATIPLSNLSNQAFNTNFCRVSVTRVPQIRRLTLNAGAKLTMLAFSGHSSSSEGGLLFLRVRDQIEMAGAGTATISMNDSGYNGAVVANYPGEGEQGIVLASQNLAVGAGGGGGSGAVMASGGGHGGLGGNTNGGGLLGDQYGCNETGLGNLNMHCLMGKIFMGGGGGVHNTTGALNKGGGIISIFANRIVIGASQYLNVTSDGGAGNSIAGGGAGGAILIRAINLDLTGAPASALNLQAVGGISSAHGGGGGGRVHLDLIGSCIAAPGVVTVGIAGGAGIPSGADGTSYFTGPAAAQCSLPANYPAL